MYWSGPKRHRKRHRKRHTRHRKRHRKRHRAAAASKLVPILATRRASKDGCRFRCILCAVGRVKADRRGPKGHPGLAGWCLGGQVCPGEPEHYVLCYQVPWVPGLHKTQNIKQNKQKKRLKRTTRSPESVVFVFSFSRPPRFLAVT